MSSTVLAIFFAGNRFKKFPRYIRVAKFFHRHPNILKNNENIDGKETGPRTVGLSNLDDGTLFPILANEWFILGRATRMYVQKTMKFNTLYAPSFYGSKRGLLRVLPGLYQEFNATSRPFFSTFICTAPFAKLDYIRDRKTVHQYRAPP